MQRPNSFKKTLFELFPEFDAWFIIIDAVRKKHFDRAVAKLKFNEYPENLIEEVTKQMSSFGSDAWTQGEVSIDFEVESLTKFLQPMIRFLGDSYLVKSASLLDGFVWSINEKNAHITALTLRQEIEVLAHSHYANHLLTKEVQPLNVNQIWNDLFRLVIGRKGTEELSRNALNVMKTIQAYDKELEKNDESPWLESYYAELSEMVHPNFGSHLLQLEGDQQFWKANYVRNRALLGDFLENGCRIFSSSLDEIMELQEGEVEVRVKSYLKRKAE